ncbi:MAG TPA: methyltransferase domain-containing protein [Patescibacteria group bacterium]|nr:methyltransferase domain-containing protein [Patescibacteria group bacterium]
MKERVIKNFFDKMSVGRDTRIRSDPILKYEQEMRQKVVMELLNPSKGELILDVGCGNARDIELFSIKGAKCVGIDISEGMIKAAKAKAKKENLKNVEFIAGDATKLPFKANTFNKVSCSETIEHMPDWRKAIREMRRVLKKNGLFVITTPNKISMYGLTRNIFGVVRKSLGFFGVKVGKKHPYDVWKTQGEVVSVLKKSGFEVKQKKGICFIPGQWTYLLPNFCKELLVRTTGQIEPRINSKLSRYGYSLAVSAQKEKIGLREKILKENIKVHEKEAEIYDFIHSEIFNKYEQKRVIKDIDLILKSVSVNQPSVLDVGCGTGNLTLKFLKKGCYVTALDLSKKMLALLKKKTDKNKFLKMINQDIESFLKDTFEKYDIISFSSVLHHLPDYRTVLEKSLDKLKNGGVIYITHEPLGKNSPDSLLTRIISLVGRLIYKIRVFPLVKEIRQIDYTMADFHAKEGIYKSLTAFLKGRKLKIKVEKYRAEKSYISAVLNNWLGKNYNLFSIIIQKSRK